MLESKIGQKDRERRRSRMVYRSPARFEFHLPDRGDLRSLCPRKGSFSSHGQQSSRTAPAAEAKTISPHTGPRVRCCIVLSGNRRCVRGDPSGRATELPLWPAQTAGLPSGGACQIAVDRGRTGENPRCQNDSRMIGVRFAGAHQKQGTPRRKCGPTPMESVGCGGL